ncbi:MAG: TVP38/TMEM64 family protein [Hyphomonadaceae bacterium]|nr:TVP38/TMEM64 family protein [Hyphomonadaceae bacterium]
MSYTEIEQDVDAKLAMVKNAQAKPMWKRVLPLVVIIGVLAAFFAFDLGQYFSQDFLKENRDALLAFKDDNFAITLIGFVLIYAVVASLPFPVASFLTIFGGFLFGTSLGGGAAILGATLGATVLFIAVKYAFKDIFKKKFGKYTDRFEAGLKENELSYLFILRLIPAYPFFVPSIVLALFDIRVRNFFFTTLFGIVPGTLVYASIGNGIGAVFDAGGEAQLSGLLTKPAVILPILGLILLSLIPIIYKKYVKKKITQ